MKTNLIRIIAACCLSFSLLTVAAQLGPGTMIRGHFNNESKQYVAEVISAQGKDFTCRFVHSSSVYTFLWRPTTGDPTGTIGKHEAVVGDTKTGAYAKGTPFVFNAFVKSNSSCHYGTSTAYPGNVVIVTFKDGRSFLGEATKTGKNCRIVFWHSGNAYTFDDNEVVIKSGGSYPNGSAAEISCVESVTHARQ